MINKITQDSGIDIMGVLMKKDVIFHDFFKSGELLSTIDTSYNIYYFEF